MPFYTLCLNALRTRVVGTLLRASVSTGLRA